MLAAHRCRRCPEKWPPVAGIDIHNRPHTASNVVIVQTIPPFRNASNFAVAMDFETAPEPRRLSAIWFPARVQGGTRYLLFHDFQIPRKKPSPLLNEPRSRSHTCTVYTRPWTGTDTDKNGTHGGNGPFLLLRCAIGRLPRLLHHLLSTAQRVPLSRQFRLLHRSVCTQGTTQVYGSRRGEDKRALPGGTSSPGVIQVCTPARPSRTAPAEGETKVKPLPGIALTSLPNETFGTVHVFVRLIIGSVL